MFANSKVGEYNKPILYLYCTLKKFIISSVYNSSLIFCVALEFIIIVIVKHLQIHVCVVFTIYVVLKIF